MDLIFILQTLLSLHFSAWAMPCYATGSGTTSLYPTHSPAFSSTHSPAQSNSWISNAGAPLYVLGGRLIVSPSDSNSNGNFGSNSVVGKVYSRESFGLENYRFVRGNSQDVSSQLHFYELIVNQGKIESLEVHRITPFTNQEEGRKWLEGLLGLGPPSSGKSPLNGSSYFEFNYSSKQRINSIQVYSQIPGLQLDRENQHQMQLSVEFLERADLRGFLIEDWNTNRFFNDMGAVLSEVASSASLDAGKTPKSTVEQARDAFSHTDQKLTRIKGRAAQQLGYRFFNFIDLKVPEDVLFQVVRFATFATSGRDQLTSRLDHFYTTTQVKFLHRDESSGNLLFQFVTHESTRTPGVSKRTKVAQTLYGVFDGKKARLISLRNEAGEVFVEDHLTAALRGVFSQEIIHALQSNKSLGFQDLVATLISSLMLSPKLRSPNDLEIPIVSDLKPQEIPISAPETALKWPFPVSRRSQAQGP